MRHHKYNPNFEFVVKPEDFNKYKCFCVIIQNKGGHGKAPTFTQKENVD